MARLKHSQDLRPLSDLGEQTSEVIHQVQETGRPVVLTERGRGVAVVLSIEAFEDLQRSADQSELQHSIDEAERDLAEGNWVEHSAIDAKLRRWSTGEP
ncbi:MAG TPA: type II toxin-antitoxin system Phd/YefM family antitoxin [Thermoanaerobaculia bacterium]|nr:type II toxin-antitoxin system Phd/YefM family antitoxin [Thermoanaerobaculia bacterium]